MYWCTDVCTQLAAIKEFFAYVFRIFTAVLLNFTYHIYICFTYETLLEVWEMYCDVIHTVM